MVWGRSGEKEVTDQLTKHLMQVFAPIIIPAQASALAPSTVEVGCASASLQRRGRTCTLVVCRYAAAAAAERALPTAVSEEQAEESSPAEESSSSEESPMAVEESSPAEDGGMVNVTAGNITATAADNNTVGSLPAAAAGDVALISNAAQLASDALVADNVGSGDSGDVPSPDAIRTEVFSSNDQVPQDVPVLQLGGSLSWNSGAGAISTPQPAADVPQGGEDVGGAVHAAFLPSSEEQAIVSEPVVVGSDAMSLTMITRLEAAAEQLSASNGRMLRGVRSVL
jgi:hypothetical protein